jgi:hypothetical protein
MAAAAQGFVEDRNQSQCTVCKRRTKALIICCDGCPLSFHLLCAEPPLKAVPEGDWFCRACESKRTPMGSSSSRLFSSLVRTVRGRNVAFYALPREIDKDYREKKDQGARFALWSRIGRFVFVLTKCMVFLLKTEKREMEKRDAARKEIESVDLRILTKPVLQKVCRDSGSLI